MSIRFIREHLITECYQNLQLNGRDWELDVKDFYVHNPVLGYY